MLRARIPELKKLRQDFSDQGFEIISVHSTAQAEKIDSFIEREAISWPACVDVNHKTAAAWNVHHWPGYFLIDRFGNVRFAGLYGGHFSDAVRELLAEVP